MDVLNEPTGNRVNCPVCDVVAEAYGTADYYLPGRPKVMTPIYRCRQCAALVRRLPPADIRAHYRVASYTDPANEARFRAGRIQFFDYLWRLACRTTTVPLRHSLDFGCSYGHFVQLLQEKGCDVTGVEHVETMRELCQARGLHVVESLTDVKADRKFDLISAIDSLYYLEAPNDAIATFAKLLGPGGLLLLRVVNRNWIALGMRRILGRSAFGSWLGDVTVGYSKKTLRVLLERNGFRAARWTFLERGKRGQSLPTKLFYLGTSLLGVLTLGQVLLTPGIIVLARRAE